jgi:hypothetical protein
VPEQEAAVRRGLTVGVLGVLEVAVDGRPVPLTTGKLRTLLVVPAMSASATVSMKRLAEAVWSDAQPRYSRRCLQIYAARLREALGREWIETRQDGLLLRAAPDAVDALRFERALDRAAAGRGSPRERELIQDALALWRRRPFDGVSSRRLEEIQAPRLTERHLTPWNGAPSWTSSPAARARRWRSWASRSPVTRCANPCACACSSRSTGAGARPRRCAGTAASAPSSPASWAWSRIATCGGHTRTCSPAARSTFLAPPPPPGRAGGATGQASTS